MIDPSQSPRDKVLWELANHGKMKKSDLRRRSGLRLSELEPIIEDLAREGRIRISGQVIVIL
jgi:hypothetical protein